MAENGQQKIWVKPVIAGGVVAVLWMPLTGASIGGALVAGIAAVGDCLLCG